MGVGKQRDRNMRTYDQSCDQVADHNRLFDRIENDGGHRRHAQNHAQVFKEAMSDELEQHRSPPEITAGLGLPVPNRKREAAMSCWTNRLLRFAAEKPFRF